jgi:hypothetical protein
MFIINNNYLIIVKNIGVVLNIINLIGMSLLCPLGHPALLLLSSQLGISLGL